LASNAFERMCERDVEKCCGPLINEVKQLLPISKHQSPKTSLLNKPPSQQSGRECRSLTSISPSHSTQHKYSTFSHSWKCQLYMQSLNEKHIDFVVFDKGSCDRFSMGAEHCSYGHNRQAATHFARNALEICDTYHHF